MGIALSDNYHHLYAEKTHEFVPDTKLSNFMKLYNSLTLANFPELINKTKWKRNPN